MLPSATAALVLGWAGITGGAAVGRVIVAEMRSLGSEIRFNCIRNSCRIKPAEVLQNYTLYIHLLNIFITYPSQIDSGLKLKKKKKFIFPLLCYSSGSFVIFSSSSLIGFVNFPVVSIKRSTERWS